MSSRHVYISGELVPEEEAKISIFDSAVTLGDTVTESTRTFAHMPFKLDRHIDRLFKSLKVTRIDPGGRGHQKAAGEMERAGGGRHRQAGSRTDAR